MAQHQDHHFFCVQQRTHAYGQRIFRHLVDVAVKEAGVCHAGVMGQRFDTRTGSQGRSRFVKRDMAVVAYAAHKQVNFTVRTDFFFIITAFRIDIRRVTVEQVNIFCWNINVIEEIAMHEAVVAFRVFFRKANIFVHVERHHMLKADLARFVHFD